MLTEIKEHPNTVIEITIVYLHTYTKSDSQTSKTATPLEELWVIEKDQFQDRKLRTRDIMSSILSYRAIHEFDDFSPSARLKCRDYLNRVYLM